MVDIDWDNGKIGTAKIVANIGGDCVIRTNQPVELKSLHIKSVTSSIGNTISFKAVKGTTYLLSAL